MTKTIGWWERVTRHRGAAGLVAAAIALAWASPVRAGGRAAAVGPGDVLSIGVFEHANLSSQVRVQEDGRIRLPLCGWITAAGKSAGELSEALSAAYAEAAIERAFVTVQIAEYGPRTVYVIGEVLQGGISLEIRPPAPLTVTQAVSTAGGFTDNADLRRVLVRRALPDGKTVEIPLDVLALISGRKNVPDVELEAGDTVIIPRSRPVYVSGEVASPGAHYVGTHSALRCSEIVGKAGGLTAAAERSRICIFRRDEDTGQTDTLEVDLEAVFAGDFAKDITIFPGDMVVVARRQKIYVFGEVGEPGAIETEPGVTLTAFQAVTLAGGFTQYASAGDVLLVREKTAQALDLRKPYRRDAGGSDPPLRPGDILVVGESIW